MEDQRRDSIRLEGIFTNLLLGQTLETLAKQSVDSRTGHGPWRAARYSSRHY